MFLPFERLLDMISDSSQVFSFHIRIKVTGLWYCCQDFLLIRRVGSICSGYWLLKRCFEIETRL
jgi:hypothetical protein